MSDLVNPPPTVKVMDYPALMTVCGVFVVTSLLLIVSGRFDPTGGVLTISLLIVLAFIGTVAFVLFFTVPNDEITAAVMGGLVAASSAVVTFWLSRRPP